MANRKQTNSTHATAFESTAYTDSKNSTHDFLLTQQRASEIKLTARLSALFEDFISIVYKLDPKAREEELEFVSRVWGMEVIKHEHIISKAVWAPKFRIKITEWLAKETEKAKNR